MIRVCSICSPDLGQVLISLKLSFSEIKKLYCIHKIHKCIYTHREKESGRNHFGSVFRVKNMYQTFDV